MDNLEYYCNGIQELSMENMNHENLIHETNKFVTKLCNLH